MAAEAGETMRLDRFLWHARIVKTRAFAQAVAGAGHLRIDGRAVDRPATPVRIGNVLTFAIQSGAVRVIEIEKLPARRGPPDEARACYSEIDTANVSQQAPGD